MKRLFFKFTLLVLRLALRLDGWTDKPRPPGYKPNPDLPFWRYVAHLNEPLLGGTVRAIESGNLAHACNKSLFNRPC